MSPSASTSAFLQSMNPAPVRSRSSLTASAVIVAIVVRSLLYRAASRARACSLGCDWGPSAWLDGDRQAPIAAASTGGGLFLLGGLASELGRDLLGARFGRRRNRGVDRHDRASARQQLVVL